MSGPLTAFTAYEFDGLPIDIATDSTTVTTKRSILRGAFVNTALSAHAVPIKSNGTTIFTIPASAAAGSWFYFGDTKMPGGILVDPNDAATGNITLVYKEVP